MVKNIEVMMEVDKVRDEVMAGINYRDETMLGLERSFRIFKEYSEEFPSSPGEINKFLKWFADGKNKKNGGKRSDVTVKTIYSRLRMVWKFLEITYDLENPMTRVRAPKVSKKVRRYFSKEELISIIDSCANDWEKATVMMLISTGCRVGGLVSLKRTDIKENGQITLREKTGQRVYTCDREVIDMLLNLNPGSEYVYAGLKTGAITMRVRRVIVRSGVKGEKLGPHTFRHSVGSMVAQATGNAMRIMELLQHDDISSSMLYIHDVKVGGDSPLSILAEYMESDKRVKQLPMGEGQDNIEIKEKKHIDVLVNDMFHEVPVNAEIRPLLRKADLDVIRAGLMSLTVVPEYESMVPDARALLARMLRKVK